MSALLALLNKKKEAIAANRRRDAAKVPDGTSRWKILPGWRPAAADGTPDATFWHDFGMHFVKDSTDTLQAIYVCTQTTFNKPCEICEQIARGIKLAGDDDMIKVLQGAKAGARVLVNAVCTEGAEVDINKPVVLELPGTVFEQIIAIAAEWEESGESILDLAKGKDLVITRTGKGIGTKYTVQAAARSTALSPDILKKLNNLDEFVARESSEGQMKALNAVRSVAGMLPAPRTTGLPLAIEQSGGATTDPEGFDDALSQAAKTVAQPRRTAAAPKPAATDVEFDDVPELTEAAAPAPAPAPAKAAAAPAPAAAASDAEIDELLAGLED